MIQYCNKTAHYIGLISLISLVRHGLPSQWWDNGGWFEFRQTVEAEAVILGTSPHHLSNHGTRQSRPQELGYLVYLAENDCLLA